MRAGRPWVPVIGLIATAATAAVALAATATSGGAIEAPGSATLNLGGSAGVTSISCATASSCAAVGYYTDGSTNRHGFVVNKKNGVWRKAIQVPGSAALNLGNTSMNSISCATATYCAAAGYYTETPGHYQVILVDKKKGVWRKAVEMPGSAALNLGGKAEPYSISCSTARSCAAGGYYVDGSGHYQAFVVNKKNGVWRKAIQVPGSAALNLGGSGEVDSISCATAGSCAAVGIYNDGSGHSRVFVANKKNGVWRKAIRMPASATVDVVGNAFVNSISCATAGSCTAGGSYKDGSGHWQPFLINETNGIWRKAIQVPGSAPLNVGGDSTVSTISCATANSCAAGGFYTDSSGHRRAFIVSTKNGVWRKAVEVPGSAALTLGNDAYVGTISCAAAGFCAAGGYYKDGSGYSQVFVVNQKKGVWRKAVEIPGSAALNTGGQADVRSISCASARSCAAGGYYTDGSGAQAFVTTR